MKTYFEFAKHRTDYKKETLAGITTFLTMSYIIVVNPAILEAAGIPKGPSMTATILAAAFGTLLMGFYAKRPFAVAPYMGENAFITFTVVRGLGASWQTALGAIFIAGVLFTLLTVLKIRGWLADTLPQSLKYSFAAGIGLFLAFIGLNETGIVALGVAGAPVSLGRLSQPTSLLAVLGFAVMAWLMIKGARGAIVIGVLAITLLSFLFGITPMPRSWVGLPPSPGPLVLQLDIAGALSPKNLPIALIIFVMAFVDTVGTLLGLSARGGFLDKKGNLPEIEKPMLADAVANLIAPVLGTTTTGAYIESAAGIEEGGRTGFTALVVSGLFLLALFFTPVLTAVPPRLRRGPRRDRHLHDQTDRRDRFQRLYRAYPGLSHDHAHDLHLQHRRGHDRRAACLSHDQNNGRKNPRDPGRHVGLCRALAALLYFLPLPVTTDLGSIRMNSGVSAFPATSTGLACEYETSDPPFREGPLTDQP
jgi:AGZA family xanthine/uracil permease-like MFS transporter